MSSNNNQRSHPQKNQMNGQNIYRPQSVQTMDETTPQQTNQNQMITPAQWTQSPQQSMFKQMPPQMMAQGQYPQGQYSQGQYYPRPQMMGTPNQYHHSQQMPPQMMPGQMPPQMVPGQMPPQMMVPGQMPHQMIGNPNQMYGQRPHLCGAPPRNSQMIQGHDQKYYQVGSNYKLQPVQYQTLPDGTVVIPEVFDSQARFDELAQPTIPPPPPGVRPNAAQLAAMEGKKIMAGKKEKWLTPTTWFDHESNLWQL